MIDFPPNPNAQHMWAADWVDAASIAGITLETMRGVADVEAAGSGFDRRGRPLILTEAHIFWRELGNTSARRAAVEHDLAAPAWGQIKYPVSSDAAYERLMKMVFIDENAALRSCSWGLFQIMGFNCEAAGYGSARAMVDDFRAHEMEHAMAFASLLTTWNLVPLLKARKAAAFARAYNGPGYARNGYDQKLIAAWARWDARGLSVPIDTRLPPLPRLRPGE